jgi:citrate lyase subunit beta/citryl-CoA lyase
MVDGVMADGPFIDRAHAVLRIVEGAAHHA